MRPRNKLLITGLVVAAAALLIAWNTATGAGRPALGVSDAKRDAADYHNRSVTIRGSVAEGSIVLNETDPNIVERFVLADARDRLEVEFHQHAPENFGPKEVVVHGRLVVDATGGVRLLGQEIQVGCASKY